jgi:hypothetical protein
MDEDKRKLAEHILNRLEGQRFADWYNTGNFNDYISGSRARGLPLLTREQILDDITKMFPFFNKA